MVRQGEDKHQRTGEGGGERRGEEIEGERRGEAISPAPLLHQEGKHSGTGPGEDTITRTHRDTQSHRQREARSIVEVKKESWCGTRVGCNPPPPRRARPGKKKKKKTKECAGERAVCP